MLDSRWYCRGRAVRRRVVTLASLCAYLATSIGMPVPAAVTSTDRPFPCQDHACGCAAAAGCWDHCCCYTASEKLAWARAHNVEPPPALLAEVAANLFKAHATQAHATQAHVTSAKASSCCSSQKSPNGHQIQPSAGATKLKFVDGWQARKCQGLADAWCATGAVVLPATVDWQFSWNLVAWLRGDSWPRPSSDADSLVRPPRA